MHQNGLSGAYIGFETCQIQQCWFWVSMISSSWKIKISKEKSSIKWGEKNPSKWNGTYAAMLLGPNSAPTPGLRTIYLNLPLKNQEKTIITQKVLVTQNSNIVHCNQHTQKPICADFQAFWNTFSLLKWYFLISCQE